MDGRRQQAGTVARRNRRARWYALVVYLLLPLVAYCAVGFAAAAHPYERPTSPDPLTDALLEIFDGEWDPAKVAANSEWFVYGSPTQATQLELAQLAADFSDDPRCWQLLFKHLDSYSERNLRLPDGRIVSEAKDVLDAALEYGVDDGLIRQLQFEYMIHDAYRGVYVKATDGLLTGTIFSESEQKEVFPETKASNTLETRNMQHRIIVAGIDALYPEIPARLNELMQSDPDRQFVWLSAAWFAAGRGDQQGTSEFLRKAAQCPFEDKTCVYPTTLLQDETLPEHSVLANYIAGVSVLVVTHPSQNRNRDYIQNLAVCAVLNNDAEQLDLLTTVVLSNDQVCNDATLMILYVYLERSVWNTYKDSLPPVVPVNISQAINQRSQLQQSFRQLFPMQTTGNAPSNTIEKLKLKLTGWFCFGSLKYFGFDPDYISTASYRIERDYLQQHVMPLWEQLPGFSYQELGWPEDTAASDENATARGGA
jgi:hypothetical protein